MDGETFSSDPDFVVIFGCRSSFAFIGLALGVVSYWISEREWDNRAPAVLLAQQEQQHEYHGDGTRAITAATPTSAVAPAAALTTSTTSYVQMNTDHNSNSNNDDASNTHNYSNSDQTQTQCEALETAYPTPWGIILGISCVWSLSFFMDLGGLGLYMNGYNGTSCLVAIALGLLVGVVRRNIIITRKQTQHNYMRIAISLLVVLLCVWTILDPKIDRASWFITVYGVICVLLSTIPLDRSRKMGQTMWFGEGKPSSKHSKGRGDHPTDTTTTNDVEEPMANDSDSNSDVCVQNFGPLLLIVGVVFVWIGTNSVARADLNQSYIPFWIYNLRGYIVFFAGLGCIVPNTLLLDYAFDEGSSTPVVPATDDDGSSISSRMSRLRSKIGVVSVCRLDGTTFDKLFYEQLFTQEETNNKFFTHENYRKHHTKLEYIAQFLESPILGWFGWFLLGVSCFLPFTDVTEIFTIQKCITLVLCWCIPIVQYLHVLPALWNSYERLYTKYSYVCGGCMVSLSIAIGVFSGIALLLSVFGVGLILSGYQKYFFNERKRGYMSLTGATATSTTIDEWMMSTMMTTTATTTTTTTTTTGIATTEAAAPSKNPNPQVYGLGLPLYILGWILLCTAMSIPM